MAATTLGFIPLQLIPTNAVSQYNFEKGFPTNGTYVVVKTPTVAQQLQLTKSLKEMQSGKEVNNNDTNKPVILRCKRRVDFTGLGCKLVDSQNPSVSRRNERERKRVKMVNMGFETLRQHVPSGRKNKKMSKVETLRSAVQYIKQLQDMLQASDAGGSVDAMLDDKIDMSELESKVSELIQSAANNSDLMDTSDLYGTTPGLPSPDQQQTHPALQQDTLQQQPHQQHQHHHHHQQHSPASTTSQGLPQSPASIQSPQFYPGYPAPAGMFAEHYDTLPAEYSQASPAGSLHSPSSSVVSDSSYDSVGDAAATPDDDDDILSGFSNWF